MTLHPKKLLLFFYFSAEAALVALVAYGAGKILGLLVHQTSFELGGMWCAISALVVLQSLLKDAKKAGIERIFGSFIGAFISGVICQWAGYGYWQLLLSIFASVYLMSIIGAGHATRLGSTTAAVIVISGMMHPQDVAWLNAFMRFIESTLGVGIAFVTVMLAEKLGIRAKSY